MEEKKEKLNRRRKRMVFILSPVIFALGSAALHFYLQYVETHIPTDDAFVDGHV